MHYDGNALGGIHRDRTDTTTSGRQSISSREPRGHLENRPKAPLTNIDKLNWDMN